MKLLLRKSILLLVASNLFSRIGIAQQFSFQNPSLSAEERAKLIDQAGQRLTLSFYAYAKIENPTQFRNDLFLKWNKLDALGRIYVATEGINAQMSVPAENIDAFRETL